MPHGTMKVLVYCYLLLTLFASRSTIIPFTYGSSIDDSIITEENNDASHSQEEEGSYSATDTAEGTCIEMTSPSMVVSPDIIGDDIIIEAEKRRMKYESCTNRDDQCATYATGGGCTTNSGYMWYHCGSSCGTCDAVIEYIASLEFVKDANENKLPCADDEFRCNFWAGEGECTANPSYMNKSCRYSCKVCHDGTNKFGIAQRTHSDTNTISRITQSIEYMELVYNEEIYQKVRHGCKNLHEDCSLWASVGECTNNPGYMELNCAPACMCCDKLDINARCPILPDNPIIWKAGDLNTLMERIVDDVDGTGEYQRYNPQALSRPVLKRDGTPAAAPGSISEKDGPWVVLLENFVSSEEADRLVELGTQQGYERSAGVGKPKHDGTHDATVDYSRTSHNTWCKESSCYEDPLVSPVVARIANITRTKNENAEYLQMLQYEPGQYYKQHHDYIEHHKGLPCGVRILTLFIYLNDVEEGGGTKFNYLDITVQPKKGSAALWPSVLDASPEDKDGRTDHEALPVTKGVKYGANAWIHNRNYKEAYAHNCQ